MSLATAFGVVAALILLSIFLVLHQITKALLELTQSVTLLIRLERERLKKEGA